MNSAGTAGARIGLLDSEQNRHYFYAETDGYLHSAVGGTNHTFVDKTYVDNKASSEATSAANSLLGNKVYCKHYFVDTASNSNVSPWGAFATINLSSDINSYGMPISIYTGTGSNSNPSSGCLNGVTARIYSRTAMDDLDVVITYMQSPGGNIRYENGAVVITSSL